MCSADFNLQSSLVMKKVHIHYSGNVQGVGFRFTAVDIARKYGVKGWVKNCGDGSVEVVAEAKDETLKAFLSDLESQMSHYIREKNLSWKPASNQFSGFEIKF